MKPIYQMNEAEVKEWATTKLVESFRRKDLGDPPQFMIEFLCEEARRMQEVHRAELLALMPAEGGEQ